MPISFTPMSSVISSMRSIIFASALLAGCDKSLATCRDRFDNLVNFRGEPYVPGLDKMVQMREELSQIWLNTSHSREQLAADLQAWCRRAEESGIAVLRDFSVKLRAVRQTA